MVTARTHAAFSCRPHPLPPARPGWFSPKSFPLQLVGPTGQKGSSTTDVRAMVEAPRKPAIVPQKVIPPLVPGGTWRKFQEVRSLGRLFESIPSSEEKVSAATAA